MPCSKTPYSQKICGTSACLRLWTARSPCRPARALTTLRTLSLSMRRSSRTLRGVTGAAERERGARLVLGDGSRHRHDTRQRSSQTNAAQASYITLRLTADARIRGAPDSSQITVSASLARAVPGSQQESGSSYWASLQSPTSRGVDTGIGKDRGT